MNLPTSLHFHGPLTFVDHGRGIARAPFARSEGIYLWCLGEGDRRFIHYVGETTDFLKRHKEHVTNILGANYGIFRADAVASDDPSPIFGGMWRDGSADAITATVGQWQGLQRDVLAYLASISVFFAPTTLPDDTRKHVEGRIARQLTERHAREARFYPPDNWTKTLPDPIGHAIEITSDLPIQGLDALLEV